jgi:hypothetical protein
VPPNADVDTRTGTRTDKAKLPRPETKSQDHGERERERERDTGIGGLKRFDSYSPSKSATVPRYVSSTARSSGEQLAIGGRERDTVKSPGRERDVRSPGRVTQKPSTSSRGGSLSGPGPSERTGYEEHGGGERAREIGKVSEKSYQSVSSSISTSNPRSAYQADVEAAAGRTGQKSSNSASPRTSSSASLRVTASSGPSATASRQSLQESDQYDGRNKSRNSPIKRVYTVDSGDIGPFLTDASENEMRSDELYKRYGTDYKASGIIKVKVTSRHDKNNSMGNVKNNEILKAQNRIISPRKKTVTRSISPRKKTVTTSVSPRKKIVTKIDERYYSTNHPLSKQRSHDSSLLYSGESETKDDEIDLRSPKKIKIKKKNKIKSAQVNSDNAKSVPKKTTEAPGTVGKKNPGPIAHKIPWIPSSVSSIQMTSLFFILDDVFYSFPIPDYLILMTIQVVVV